MGIAYQPTFIVADAIRAGRLVPILTAFPTPRLEMYAVFPAPLRAATDTCFRRFPGVPSGARAVLGPGAGLK